jgi:pyrroline-5-carboxylate reductase
MLKKRIAFIGAGAMGEAVISGTLRKKLVKPADLVAAAPRQERLAELHKEYDIETTTSKPQASMPSPRSAERFILMLAFRCRW